MTLFETAFSIVCILLTGVAMVYFIWLVRTSGQDPIRDPKLVKQFRETAPYEKLDQVLDPSGDEEGFPLEDGRDQQN